jgi:hypothetical protein
MNKKIVMLPFFALFFSICSAPDLSDIVWKTNEKFALSEIKRWVWEIEFARWKNDLGFKESSGDWTIYNRNGCIGTYQFRIATIEHLGYKGITFEKFKSNPEIFPPELQEEVFRALIKKNAHDLKKFEKYIGLTVKGVLITRSGLLAAAHLGGIIGVKSFLLLDKNVMDMNGTSVRDYLIKFQGYDI